MSDKAMKRDETPAGVAPEESSAPPGKGTRVGASIVLALIAASLLWYFAADRLTPHTSQARVQAGAPAMTLIAIHDLWINADMTENNLGNIDPGDEVAIVLDVLPGEVLKGRVRSIGSGVSSGQQAQAGTLPTIQNSRDWLRQAQRFPVTVEFDAAERERLQRVRIGGQAEVMVFSGDNFVMNLLGAGYIRLMSWLSYLY